MQIGEAYTILWYFVIMVFFAFSLVVAWYKIRENKDQLFGSRRPSEAVL